MTLLRAKVTGSTVVYIPAAHPNYGNSMRYLFDPWHISLAASVSGLIGTILLGPVTCILMYAYVMSPSMGSRLHCGAVRWYVGYDYRNGCTVDVAERVRCGGEGAACFELDRGHFGGYPPTLSALIDDWVYVGTMVMGMGVTHIFVAVCLQAIVVGHGLIIGVAYTTVLAFWGVVGTSSYGGDKVLQTCHQTAAVAVFVLSFVTTSLMLYSCGDAWGSQLAYVLHAGCCVSLFMLLCTFVFAGVTGGANQACDEQYLANGMLGMAEQLYLLLYTTLLFVVFRTTYYSPRSYWFDVSMPPGLVFEDDLSVDSSPM